MGFIHSKWLAQDFFYQQKDQWVGGATPLLWDVKVYHRPRNFWLASKVGSGHFHYGGTLGIGKVELWGCKSGTSGWKSGTLGMARHATILDSRLN